MPCAMPAWQHQPPVAWRHGLLLAVSFQELRKDLRLKDLTRNGQAGHGTKYLP